jgi:hypothetical protein
MERLPQLEVNGSCPRIRTVYLGIACIWEEARIPAVARFGLGLIPSEEFEQAVLAVVAQLLKVVLSNQVKFVAAKLVVYALRAPPPARSQPNGYCLVSVSPLSFCFGFTEIRRIAYEPSLRICGIENGRTAGPANHWDRDR